MNLLRPSFCRGLFLAAFSVVIATALSAADAFEGRVYMQLTSGKRKEPTSVTYAIKPGKLRFDTTAGEASSRRRGGGATSMIMDLPNREMIMLMDHDGQKMFMRHPMPDASAAPAAERAGREVAAPVATGRTEMIAGYEASEYKWTSPRGEIHEMWLAKGLGTFVFPAASGGPMGGRGGSPSPEWEKIARDGGFFPLRVVTRDAGGTETARMEVTKIEKGSLPDSLFSTDGYTEFKMPDMGELMKGLRQR
ncbi:MAG: DUF4412 domain-containing protein [Verrucomicrobia bacterium]|nr:DUF4412 domain-containing protein [Verrucomicrobiota bacterium]